jgi:hypothetical protein
MRNAQSGFVNHFPVIQNEIEIECARGTLIRAYAAAFALDGQQRVEQFAWGQKRFPDGGAVQEIRLRGNTNRRRFVPRGHAKSGKKLVKALDGKCEMTLAVTHVAAERDGYPIQSTESR